MPSLGRCAAALDDAVEGLLIGRGLQKGEDYDREVGRVKVSAKEAIPDFILMKLGLALELKLISRADRVKEAVDVYDLGFIRDELEFRQDLERTANVSVIIVKH